MSLSPAAALTGMQTKSDADSMSGLRTGLALMLLAFAALTLLLYAAPPFVAVRWWGLNPYGMQQFRLHWGLSALPKLNLAAFSLAFRLLLVVLWSGYALLVLSVRQGAVLSTRSITLWITGAAIFTALFAPPFLSTDVYAYAAHGRLWALYGQNPYFQLPSYLARAHDPSADYLVWNWPTIYGPVWTRIEGGAVWALRGQTLWTQVLALKLVEAAALIGMAFAGRRIVARLAPGRENLTLLAIGLNPLLLLEGPGSGHNDILMICLLLVGTMFYVEKKYVPAALFLGLSVGIKVITLLLLPWVWMEWARERTWSRRLLGGIVAFCLVLLPTALCYVGLWHGKATLGALQARSLFNLSRATLLENYAVAEWLKMHGVGAALAGLVVTLVQNRWLLGTFAVLTLWLFLRPRPAQWLVAWAVLSALLMFFALGVPFPWYICWFWPVCLLRWDKVGVGLSAACFGLSLAWTAGYAMFQP